MHMHVDVIVFNRTWAGSGPYRFGKSEYVTSWYKFVYICIYFDSAETRSLAESVCEFVYTNFAVC